VKSREFLFQQLVSLGLVEESIKDPSLLDSCRPEPIRYLASKGLFDEQKALTLLSKDISIPFISIKDSQSSKKIDEAGVFKSLNPALLWQHKILPLWKEENWIAVAFANPFNQEVKQILEFTTSLSVKQYLATEEEILNYLSKRYPIDSEKYDYIEDVTSEKYVEIVDSAQQDDDIDSKSASAPPIVRLVNMILTDALKARASDIHIEPLQSSLEVRFRVDGKMLHFLEIPKRLQSYVISRIKLLSDMDIAERRKPQDGRFRARIGDQLVDFRTSCVPSVHGEALVLRLLNSDNQLLSFSDLGINTELETRLIACLERDSKMLLVTGPTGSGKTTTLYSCLVHLNDKTRNIITVENPVEYRLKGITQIKVNEATGVTFASSLRAILRQDPDVVMIGEIRDSETANIAIEAAMTGHKVLSTVHTNDAPSAITRLTHLGVSTYSISCAVSGILAQRLVRKLCKRCSEPMPLDQIEKYSLEISHYGLNPKELLVSKGCEECGGIGYKGRSGLYSFLDVDEQVVKLLETNAALSEITDYAKKNGYQDISAAAIAALKAGTTSLEEVHPYLDVNDSVEQEDVNSTSNLKNSANIEKDSKAAEKITSVDKTKLLIVEDDPDIRFMLKTLFERELFDVALAENGQKALESVYESIPSIILCDLKMPIMDGREFMKRLKSNPQTKSLPVIILTGNDDEENEVDALDLGAKDFISKASSPTVILARIRRAMDELS